MSSFHTSRSTEEPKPSEAGLTPGDFGIGQLFWVIGDAVVVGDASSGRIVLWNPRAEAMFGYPSGEALNMLIEDLVPEELRDRHRAGIANFAQHGVTELVDTGRGVELPAVRKDGKRIWIDLVLSRLAHVETPGIYVLAVIRDVTERRRTQEILRRQERFAALGELATVIGHELRNPLGAVLNGLFLLRQGLGAITTENERNISSIERQVNRAARLSEDLTAYMREREPVVSDIAFDVLVEQVLEATPPVSGIEVTIGDTVQFRADASLMTQVVTNVLTNAYQAMPDGGAVRLSATTGDDTTFITIQDSGPGIDPTVASRLFDPFFTTKSDGTGLGLAIVQRLVELHGGTVSIENGSSGGASIVIRLPSAPLS